MYKLGLVLLLVSLVLISGCTTQEKASTSPEPGIKKTKFTDPAGRFSLDVPEGWEKQNVSIFDASFGFLDEHKGTMRLIGVNIKENFDNITTEHALVGTKAALGSSGTLTEIGRGNVTLNNGKDSAMFMEFSATFSGIDVKGKLVIIAKANVASVMFLSNSEEYGKYLKEADVSLNSFTIGSV